MISARTWLMWLCASLFYGYQYVLRVILNVLKDDISNTFQFDAISFGQFAGIYYLGYTLAHIPLGLMLDRYGPKRILPLSIFICTVGMAPLLLSTHSEWAIAGRFFLGIGSSCAFIGLVKIVHIAFSENKINKMISFGSIFGLVGAVFAGAPVEYILEYVGWKNVILASILIGCVLAIVLFFIIPAQKKEKVESPLSSILFIIKNKWVWMIAIGAGFMVGPIEGFADAWAVQVLKSLYEINASQASQGVSLIYFGFAVGLAGLTFFVDKIGLDKTIILSGAMVLLAFLGVLSGAINLIILILLLFVLGFFSAYQVPALCRAATFVPKNMTSLTTAIANTIVMFFGMYFHSIIGHCVHIFGGEQMKTCSYNSEIYQQSLFIIPVMIVFGIMTFIFVYKKNKENTL